MTDLGIVIPAIGLDEAVVDRCKAHIDKAGFSGSLQVVVIREPKTSLPNISRARNKGIRQLRGCKIVACLDADLIMPDGLMEEARGLIGNGVHLWQCPTDASDAGTVERQDGKGAWNVLSYQDWVKVGGWDERCCGWGGDDDILHRDISLAGIRSVKSDIRVLHPWHESRCARRGRENLIIAKPTTWNWIEANGHMCLQVTSQCNLDCRDCCMSPLMSLNPEYELSMNDLRAWIQVTQDAHYHFASVVLTGGEPTLCRHLPEIARVVKQSGICDRIKIFTNCVKLPEMQKELLLWVDQVEVSDHGQPLPDLSVWGRRAWIRDKKEHSPRPVCPVPNAVPADCVGVLEFCLYDGSVYECPCAVATALYYGTHADSAIAKGRYLDELMSTDRYNQDLCRLCTSNRKVRAHVGTRPVNEV